MLSGMTERETLAWIAGFFDGEGSVGVYLRKTTGTATCVVAIGNTDLPALKRIHDVSGGKLAEIRSGHRDAGNQPYWRIQVGGAQAETFLRRIRPYSSAKAAQIDCFLAMRDLQRNRVTVKGLAESDHERRREVVARLAALKRSPTCAINDQSGTLTT